MKSEMKRIAIIGAGKIVEDNHLPVLCAMNDVEVAWCCDLNASRRDLMRNVSGFDMQSAGSDSSTSS